MAGGMEIDYIHGTEDVLELGTKDNGTGILLPPIAKESFFETIDDDEEFERVSNYIESLDVEEDIDDDNE